MGRRYGLTMFRVCNKNGADPAYPPVALAVRVPPARKGSIPLHCRLAQACQRLWLVVLDGVYRQFTYVGRTIQPGAPSALALAEAIRILADRIEFKNSASLSRQLHTSPLPATHVSVGYCWRNNRFPPLITGETITYATSCRTPA